MGAEKATALDLRAAGPDGRLISGGASVQYIGNAPSIANRAEALTAAMRILGAHKTDVARWLGCDEKIVRDMLAGRRPITNARVESMPPRLRVAFDRCANAGFSDRAEQLKLF